MCQRVSVIRILLSAPHAKDPMLIVVNPYSKNQEKIAEYAPADIDSIVVWPRSNSAVRLTFVFLKKYGLAMKIDQSQKYDVYQFASKGYGLLGSTCRWFYGDSKLLVGDGGVKTVADLLRIYRSGLISIRNIGVSAATEIEQILSRANLINLDLKQKEWT